MGLSSSSPRETPEERSCRALVAAARTGDLEGVRRVLGAESDAGALVAAKSVGVALAAAAESGSDDVVALLLADAPLLGGGDDGGRRAQILGTALLQVALRGLGITLDSILEVASPSVVDFRREDGSTALYLAAERGHLGVVSRLVRAGARVDLANQRQASPLWIASCRGHAAVVRALLRAGAQVDAKDANGERPLHAAVESDAQGAAEVVLLLLEAGADVGPTAPTRTSTRHPTPLWLAARHGRTHAVGALLRHRACWGHRVKGSSPLRIAAQYGHDSAVAALILAGADETEALAEAESADAPLVEARVHKTLKRAEAILRVERRYRWAVVAAHRRPAYLPPRCVRVVALFV